MRTVGLSPSHGARLSPAPPLAEKQRAEAEEAAVHSRSKESHTCTHGRWVSHRVIELGSPRHRRCRKGKVQRQDLAAEQSRRQEQLAIAPMADAKAKGCPQTSRYQAAWLTKSRAHGPGHGSGHQPDRCVRQPDATAPSEHHVCMSRSRWPAGSSTEAPSEQVVLRWKQPHRGCRRLGKRPTQTVLNQQPHQQRKAVSELVPAERTLPAPQCIWKCPVNPRT